MVSMRRVLWRLIPQLSHWPSVQHVKLLRTNRDHKSFHSKPCQTPQASIYENAKGEAEFLPHSERNVGEREPKIYGPSGDWKLTVGIEIHAQLNTDRKLFSSKSPDFHGHQASSNQG